MRNLWLIIAGIFLGAVGVVIYDELSHGENLSSGDVKHYLNVVGLEFTDEEIELLLPDAQEQLEGYKEMRTESFPNHLFYPLNFTPLPYSGQAVRNTASDYSWLQGESSLPATDHEIAFLPVTELSKLIRAKKLSSERLTFIYLKRLKAYGDTLEAVITLMEDRALEKARQMDAELAQGKYRGPLHGIPYGIKDLLAVKGTLTTWGATPYKNQIIDETAEVVQKLNDAGAVLTAKLTLGALAWGDVWYGGKTRNPWNLEQGASGSSAGPASATSAGLVAFALGTETLGSIVSPSTRNGVTGHRPTFGTVSKHGAMALSWSMDKIGPIARSAQDCALIFDVMRGRSELDTSTRDINFDFKPLTNLDELRVGYSPSFFDGEYGFKTNDSLALNALKKAGVNLIPVDIPSVPAGMRMILSAEAAAAFDELTRSNRDDEMVRQIRNAWPNVFRAARLIPAVEYIQANRLRSRLVEETEALFENVDVIITPSFNGSTLYLTNLTGHPTTVFPTGFGQNGSPTSMTIISALYQDEKTLQAAAFFQSITDHDEKHPPFFFTTPE